MVVRLFAHNSLGSLYSFRILRPYVLFAMTMLLSLFANFSHASNSLQATFEGWSVNCGARPGSDVQQCVATQSVTIGGDASKMVVGVMVAHQKEHALPHIVFRISPSANREKGVAVKVDEFDQFQVPITNCDQNVCEIRSFIPENLLAHMRKGKLLQFAFFLNDKQVTYPISLEGFNKTYQTLLSHNE